MSGSPHRAPTPNQFRANFRDEAIDLLRDLEASLLALQDRAAEPEEVDGIFRSLHTIKGSGAMFGFSILADFTHHLENAFDAVRTGKLPLSRELIDLALEGVDHMRGLILNTGAGDRQPRQAHIDRLTKLIRSAVPANEDHTDEQPASHPSIAPSSAKLWRVHFAPGPETMCFGSDPALLIRELGRMGSLEALVDYSNLPPLRDIDPDRCYLSWQISLHTNADPRDIREVFLFVEDSSEIDVRPEEDIPVSPASVSPPAAVTAAPTTDGETKAATVKKTGSRQTPAGESSSVIRVATAKLDQLVNLVGELVTVQARLNEIASRQDNDEMNAIAEDIERLSSALRESSMNVRLTPIRDTFERFRRLVYDLSRDLDKSVQLTIEGAETELDKTVIDQLNDPMLHLIRNSMDHGLETAQERVQSGKPAQGTLKLEARYAGACVLVSVTDDGRGIDVSRVKQRGIERGLIPADAVLNEAQVFNLIFEPGFSTAAQVTDLSGRGVGMDVVRRSIDKLRGSIDVASVPNKGTTITLRIPLTLAIIDGLLVTVGKQYFVLPLAHALECIELSRKEIDNANGKQLIRVRDEVIAYIRLREYFGIQADLPPFEQAMIVTTEAGQYGLVVDRVLGDCQTMVKSLGKLYGGISEFSGATILGNGSVALILDPLRLVQERLKSASSSGHNLIRSSMQSSKGLRHSLASNDGGRDSLQAYSDLQQTPTSQGSYQ